MQVFALFTGFLLSMCKIETWPSRLAGSAGMAFANILVTKQIVATGARIAMIEHKSAGEYIEQEARELLSEILKHQEQMSKETGRVVGFDKAKNDYFDKFFESFVFEFRNAHTVAS